MVDPVQPIRPEFLTNPIPRSAPPGHPRPPQTSAALTGLIPPRLEFSLQENGEVIVRMFSRVTGQLIRQIPPAERLRMAARIADFAQRYLG